VVAVGLTDWVARVLVSLVAVLLVWASAAVPVVAMMAAAMRLSLFRVM
jgi:hypothetical protein